MIGFARDDTPRDFDAIQRPSGLWVAGAKYLDDKPEVSADGSGPSSASVLLRKPWFGHANLTFVARE